MSFYRKYRPQLFDEIDNPHVQKQLQSLLTKEKGDLPHAYFLTGPKGTGKTTTARLIAKLFNCTAIKKTGPCGRCDQCIAIAEGSSLDVIEMDAASNRGIDEIRQLRERIGLAPVSASHTTYIIDEVHMLTTEAFNALLKTLEEPPKHAVFVLATTDAHKVPGTIVSRCLLIPFARAGIDELTNVVLRIAKKENISINNEGAALIAAISDGSFRDAAKLLEQISFLDGEITETVIRQTLRISGEKRKRDFVSHLLSFDQESALSDIASVAKDGQDMKEFVTGVLSLLHDALVDGIVSTTDTVWKKGDLIEAIRRLTAAYDELRFSPIAELPIELAVIEFCDARGAVIQKNPKDEQGESYVKEEASDTPSLGLLTIEKLVEHWSDFISATKPLNHSIAGVLRSSRPMTVKNGIVTIAAFYKFHQEKLADAKTKQVLADVLKKLFGEKVKIEIILGKK